MKRSYPIKTSFMTFLFICSSVIANENIVSNAPIQATIQESKPDKILPEETKGVNQTYGVETGLTGTISPKIEAKKNKTLGLNTNEEVNNYVKVSLIDVVLETVANNYNVKIAREKVEQAKLNLDEAYSGYKPTVDVEYKYGTTEKTPSDDGIDSPKNRYHDETAKLQVKQNLYAGGATHNKIKGLEKSLEVAKNRYELAISQEIQNAIKAYFGVVFSYQSLYATRINMEMLQKILEIVTIKYDLGAASIGDISSIKASVSNAESKLSKTNSKFVESLKYYEYIVGEDFKYTLPYEYEFKIELAPLEELLILANEENLNIVSYLTTVESEKYKLKGAQSAYEPKVDLEFTHTRIYDKDIEPEEYYRQNMNEAYVTVKYNLYNGDRDSNKILSVYSTIRETKYKIEEERRKLKWIISNLHQSLNALESSIGSTKQEVESSQVTVESYWEAFKNGEQDLQTLLTAQRQLNTAQVSLIEFYESRLNDYFKLTFETGQLVSHFELDPTKANFIDFTRSKYNKNTIKSKEDMALFASIFEKSKEEAAKEKAMETKVVDTIEDILIFKDKFLDANDEYFTLYIGEFDTIYDTFGYIKNNALSKQAFMIDVLNDYKLKNIMAYGIYETMDLANGALNEMAKNETKEYKVVSIKTIKDLYKTFIDGFDELRPKEFVETKTITLAPKAQKEYVSNESFKEQFIASKADTYTINLVTFAKLDDAITLVNKENIAENSLIFRYGTNAEWIKIAYGVFPTYEEANAALSKLSYETKEKYFPVIEFIKDKQELYEKYQHLSLGVPTLQFEKVEYETISEDTKREIRELKEERKEKKTVIPEEKKIEPEPVLEEPAVQQEEFMPEQPDHEPLEKDENELEIKQEKPISFKEEFLNAPSSKYTLNIATLATQEESEKFMKMNKIEEKAFSFIFGEETSNSKVMYGVFDTYQEAQEAAKNLPKTLKRNNPRVEQIQNKQDLYKKYNAIEPNDSTMAIVDTKTEDES
ncbi:MAG: TolC family protein [Arcobacteraceae bacterium]